MTYKASRPGLGAAVLITLGAALRIVPWLQNRSLWLDEARLGLNVASRSYASLFPPLDYDQSAPLLYLWLQRLAVSVFGVGELSLRLLSLLAGITTVALTYLIARRLASTPVALLGTAMAALSPTLIQFSNEAKQYAVETLVSCVIIYLSLRWLEEPTQRGWRNACVIFGAIAVWLAAAAPLVLCGATVALLLTQSIRPVARLRWATQLAGFWGASVAIAYVSVYRYAENNSYLRHYWDSAFLSPGGPSAFQDRAVAIRALLWAPLLRDNLWTPGDLVTVLFICAISVVFTLILAVGTQEVVRSRGAPGLALLIAPVVLAILLSVAGVYPISVRTTAFSMPSLLIVAAAGVGRVAGRLRWPLLRRTVLAGSCLPMALLAYAYVCDRDPSENLRPLVDVLQQHRRLGEPVYIFAGAIPAWAMYTTDWRARDSARLSYLSRIARAGGPAFENAPSRGHPVVKEGADLIYYTPLGSELYGIPAGLEARVFRLTNREPDQGWSENEAARIRSVANPGVWLILSHFYGPERSLLSSLEASGGRTTYKDIRRGAALIRYEFPHCRGNPVASCSKSSF
jgi:4-amino-4-deoxy-L-arabinose transferase-like glycosyltransferase